MKASPATLTELGTKTVMLWASYLQAMHATQHEQPPWSVLLAPTFVNLQKRWIQLLLIKSTAPPADSVGFHPGEAFLRSLASMLEFSPPIVLGCHHTLYAVPFASRSSMPVCTVQPIHDWLLSDPQQRQQLFQHLNSGDFSWFFWRCLTTTVAALEDFTCGKSPALGCALPLEFRVGPVKPTKDVQASGMKQHVNCLLGVLRAHHLLCPCEPVLAYLIACQQQQQQGLLQEQEGPQTPESPSYSSSSSSGRANIADAGTTSSSVSSSSSSGSNKSSTNRRSTFGSRGALGVSNAAAASGGGGSGGHQLGAGGSSHLPSIKPFSISTEDLEDAVRSTNGDITPGVLWLMLQPPSSARGCTTDRQEHANSSSSKGNQQQQGNSQLLHASNAMGSSGAVQGALFATSQGSSSTAREALHQAPAAAEGGLRPHASGKEEVAVVLEQLQLVLQLLFIAWPSMPRGANAGSGATAAEQGRGATAGGAVPAAGATGATAEAGTAAARSAEDKAGTAGTAVGGGKGGQPQAPACQEATDQLGILEYEQSCWGLLLLLAALLQQAPAEAKQLLMQQQEGTMLLQLLYRVLLDQDMMEKENCRDSSPLLLVDMPVIDMLNVLKTHLFHGPAPHVPLSVVQLVLMVLQGLLLVAADPWGPEEEEEQLLKQTVGVILREGEGYLLLVHQAYSKCSILIIKAIT